MNKPPEVVPFVPQKCAVRASFVKAQGHLDLLPDDEGQVRGYCIVVMDAEGAVTHRYVYDTPMDLLALAGALAEMQTELLSTRGDVGVPEYDDDTP